MKNLTLLMLFLGLSFSIEGRIKSMFKPIEFESQGATLRGRLYLPEPDETRFPVIVMAHGFSTTVNGMTADKYAERYRESGYAVLLYDHRNLGGSDGEPRQEINFWVQSRGYVDAIDFVSSQPEIDTTRIAVWGASLSAGEAFLVGTIDQRVKAVITMIPAFGEKLPMKDPDGSSYAFAKETLSKDDIRSMSHKITGKMTIVSDDQIGTPSVITELTAYRWFIEYGGRFGTNWKNVVSFSKIESPEDFHLGQLAPNLKAPIIMIVATNDEMNGADPEVTEHVYNDIDQPKEWVDIDGGHFGLLYYPSEMFEKSSRAQIDFLNRYFKS